MGCRAAGAAGLRALRGGHPAAPHGVLLLAALRQRGRVPAPSCEAVGVTCPRCAGPLFRERDIYGDTLTCLSCGHTRDLDSRGELVPIMPVEWFMRDASANRRREPLLRGRRIKPVNGVRTERCGAPIVTTGQPCGNLVAGGGRCHNHR